MRLKGQVLEVRRSESAGKKYEMFVVGDSEEFNRYDCALTVVDGGVLPEVGEEVTVRVTSVRVNRTGGVWLRGSVES